MDRETTRYKKLKIGASSIPVKLKLKKRGIHDWKRYPHINLDQSGGSYRSTLPTNKITTTKYTLLNFIPKNIFEQFRRMTNIYFLMIVCITLIPAISPLNPWTSILPLSFVLGVTAIKEGYEDFQRFKEDNKVNNKQYMILKRNGKQKKKKSRSLKVGDFVRVRNGQYLPADIVPFLSSLPDGVIYIETAQLDGETNLKLYRAPPVTNSLSESEVLNLKGHIECEKPTFDLNNWGANLVINDEKHPLTAPNLLLRGAKVKNTDWIIGMVVYSGRFTKLSLNQKLPPSKFSTVESRLNKAVISIFTFKMCLVITCTIGSAVFNNRIAPDAWYLDTDSSPAFQATKDFFAYFALLSFMIPMSLMVTLEVVKVVQGQLMEWDEQMALNPDNVKETGMKPKTTNLNDELALVKYIFSDKTGTLTENCMEFKKVSVNGVVYDDAFNGELLQEIESGGENAEYVREFLMCLAICQSAVPDTDKKGNLVYKAQSPDEEALCDGARANGYIFTTRTQTQIIVNIQGEDQTIEILKEIEFSSDRKKMTVVCRLPDGRIRVYSKGADSAMFEILGKDVDDNIRSKTNEDIDGFSQLGLRTLLVCYKEMSEEEFEEWNQGYYEAETFIGDPKDKKKKLAEAALRVENNFQLIGCSAIEDRLQQMVPETIHNLLRANIKVWVITGDKQETAVNIGHSCKLLKSNMEIVYINATDEENCREILKSSIETHCKEEKSDDDKELAVVIDGATLVWALTPELSPQLLQITSLCHSVVCCRVSPLQKALIVRLMKEYTKEVCLSIGDGANDVSMIQEAHIGVGIFGKEGTQAARSADYAIRQFRHLIRLLTVHGRYSYIRNCGLIQYSFYKNVAAFLVQFWFAFYSGYSATTIYDDWIVTFFNIFFTSIPPFFYAVFEKDITEDVIYEYPEAYRYVQRGKLFTYSTLCYWMLSALWCSLVFFFGSACLLYNEPYFSDGRSTGLRLMGNMASTIAIFTVILKICTISHLWNVIVHLGVWASMTCYALVFLIESFLPTIFPTQYFMWVLVVINPNFWGLFLLSLIICLIPDVFFEYLKRQFFPDDWMILQEAHKYRKFEDVKRDLKAVEEIREQKRVGLIDDKEPV